ncbi:MAG: class I SAM-dependent methyltransferase [Anaerolineaceae bacterium]|nr:class I SAM-dependent methyltransferase [Anaerolineaceae bacterium]
MTVIDRMMYDVMYRISKPVWDDGRVPPQVVQLASLKGKTRNALDLGCGTGTHSIYLAQQGFAVVGVDLSPTAIWRAQEKTTWTDESPRFVVHDVTRLDFLDDPFDIALDVGCFHGLNKAAQQRYALELTRLLEPGSIFLLWGMDDRPLGSGVLSPDTVDKTFAPGFKLDRFEASRLHGRPSKWYWLVRQ